MSEVQRGRPNTRLRRNSDRSPDGKDTKPSDGEGSHQTSSGNPHATRSKGNVTRITQVLENKTDQRRSSPHRQNQSKNSVSEGDGSKVKVEKSSENIKGAENDGNGKDASGGVTLETKKRGLNQEKEETYSEKTDEVLAKRIKIEIQDDEETCESSTKSATVENSGLKSRAQRARERTKKSVELDKDEDMEEFLDSEDEYKPSSGDESDSDAEDDVAKVVTTGAQDDEEEVEVVIDEKTGQMVAYTRDKAAARRKKQTPAATIPPKLTPVQSINWVQNIVRTATVGDALAVKKALSTPTPLSLATRVVGGKMVLTPLIVKPKPIQIRWDTVKTDINTSWLSPTVGSPPLKAPVMGKAIVTPQSRPQPRPAVLGKKKKRPQEVEEEIKIVLEDNDMTEIFKKMPYFKIVHSTDRNTHGYVTNVEDYNAALRDVVKYTGIRLPKRKHAPDFGSREMPKNNPSIVFKLPYSCKLPKEKWQPLVVPTDDIPMYPFANEQRHFCQFGTDRFEKRREGFDKKNEELAKKTGKKYRKSGSLSSKSGCGVIVGSAEVISFPDFKITKSGCPHADGQLRYQILQHVKWLVRTKQPVKMEKRLYIRFPTLKCHSTHPMPEVDLLTHTVDAVDKKVEAFIRERIEEGLTRLDKMDKEIRKFSKKEFEFKRMQVDTAFFPGPEALRSCMHRILMEKRFNKLKEEGLQKMVDDWKKKNPDDLFHFRPMDSAEMLDVDIKEPSIEDDVRYRTLKITNPNPDKNLLFVYQTQAQQYLMKRYHSVCFVDPVYRRMEWDFPVFLLVVKTNVSYACVGIIIVQYEDVTSIAEALKLIKEQLGKQEIKSFMLDTTGAEKEAVRQVFPDCETFICDFHRELSYGRFVQIYKRVLNPPKHNPTKYHHHEMLEMLDECARAETERAYFAALVQFHESVVWKRHKKVQDWFKDVWENNPKTWVYAHQRNKGIYINCNDGLKRMKKVFNYEFLQGRKDDDFSTILRILVECFVPLQMSIYSRENRNAPQKISGQWPVREYLRNRPPFFIRHCMKQMDDAQYPKIGMISEMKKEVFKVQGTQGEAWNTVDMNKDKFSCTCKVWGETEMPCSHIFSIVENTHHTWQNIPEELRKHPLFTLDREITKLVNPDVVVSKEMTVIASSVLEELDAGVETLKSVPKYGYKQTEKRPKKPKSDLMDFVPNNDVSDDDDDEFSNMSEDVTADGNRALSLDQLTSHVRQQCANITDATYQTTSAEALAQASRLLDDALQTLSDSLPNDGFQTITSAYGSNLQEEVVYGGYYG